MDELPVCAFVQDKSPTPASLDFFAILANTLNMPNSTVTSTEFQTRAGLYIERAAKAPVFITKHSRPVRVLLDIDEYERMKARDTRRAYYVEELPDDMIEAIANTDLSHLDSALDALLN
jgi:prevent-host-death family protein